MTSGDALRNRKKQKIVGYHYISDIMGRCRKFRENAGNTNFRIRNDGVGGSNPSCGTTIPSKDIQRSPKSLVYFRKIIDLLSNVVWPRPLTSGKFGGIFRGSGWRPAYHTPTLTKCLSPTPPSATSSRKTARSSWPTGTGALVD